VLLVASACVLFPYFLLTNAESINAQVLFLFLFGIVIAGALLWSLIPRRKACCSRLRSAPLAPESCSPPL
jgi:hypothetical protein